MLPENKPHLDQLASLGGHAVDLRAPQPNLADLAEQKRQQQMQDDNCDGQLDDSSDHLKTPTTIL